MKKRLILPLAALLCFACTKDNALAAPEAPSAGSATRTANETVLVMVNDMIDHSVLECDSYIDYTDRNGTPVSFNLMDIRQQYVEGNYLEVQRGSALTFRIRLWYKNTGSDKIYCAIRYEPWGSGGPWRNFSDYGFASGELTITDIQADGMQFGIWASGQDFSGGELDNGQPAKTE